MVYASAPAFVEAVENSLKDALPEYHNGGALYVYFQANDFVKSVQLAHWIGGSIREAGDVERPFGWEAQPG